MIKQGKKRIFLTLTEDEILKFDKAVQELHWNTKSELLSEIIEQLPFIREEFCLDSGGFKVEK